MDAAKPPPSDRALGMARLALSISAVAAPLAHAALLPERPQLLWLSLGAMAVAAALRLVAPAAALPAVVGLGPVWQVLMARLLGQSDPQVLAAWLGAAAVASIGPQRRWHASGWWRVGLAGWGLAIALSWPLVAFRELDFTTRTLRVATLNGSWGATPHESAAFVALAALAQMTAILLFDWYGGAAAIARARLWRAILPGFVAACGLALWQAGVDVTLLNTPTWISYGRAAGTLFDGNAMGALAALVGLSAAARGIAGRRRDQVLALILLGAALGAIVATGSRGALGGTMLAVAIAATRTVASRRSWRAAGAVVLVLAVVLGVARSAGTGEGSALARLETSIRSVARGGPGTIRDELWTRDGYGPASMAMIADQPWSGVGVGVFGTVVSDYASLTLDHPLPPDSAQNWWRHQLAELGLFGAPGAVLCSWLAALAAARMLRGPQAAAWDAAPLLALAVMAMVGAPTQHPLVQAITGLVVAAAVQRPAEAEAAARAGGAPRLPKWAIAAPWVLGMACAAAVVVAGVRGFRPSLRAERFGYLYAYGFAAGPGPGGEGAWAATQAVGVIGKGRSQLRLRVILPHGDLPSRPAHLTISDRGGVRCQAEVRDASPVSCDLAIGPSGWKMVRIDVDRAGPGGRSRSAFVTWQFDP